MRMKSRLSLTVDPRVIRQAKRVAKKRNMSLSGLVESLLEEASDSSPKANPSRTFSQRWKGKLEVTARDEARFEGLATKHGL